MTKGTGFIVQTPLPKHMNTQKVLEAISSKKMSMDLARKTWEN